MEPPAPHTFIPSLSTTFQSPAATEQDPQLGHLNPSSPLFHSLITTSVPLTFQLGTGASLLTQTLILALLCARHEILFVTCFWARSASLDALSSALKRVAQRRIAARRRLDPVTGDRLGRRSGSRQRNGSGDEEEVRPLRVRIGLSSTDLFQKLLHTTSRDGYVYPASTWVSRLNLPDPDLLHAAGIDLQVKSLFFLPFSVMHPKFLIVDRHRAWLPSCNVSWEAWLECCVAVEGDVVKGLVGFYERTWEPEVGRDSEREETPTGSARRGRTLDLDSEDLTRGLKTVKSTAESLTVDLTADARPIPTILLPSPHHRNPHFRPFPWQTSAPAPKTPLNVALLHLFAHARTEIYIQTPNVTSQPVLQALLSALDRGVNVTIVTGRNMMVWEQLVTAGTTTSWCLRGLLKRYESMLKERQDQSGHLEAARPAVGRLRISFFRPKDRCGKKGKKRKTTRDGAAGPGQTSTVEMEEPVHSHVKLTIADGKATVLGSGNMERASWFTSQELGILFEDERFAGRVRESVGGVLEGRVEGMYDSEARTMGGKSGRGRVPFW